MQTRNSHGLVARFLAVGTFWKILLANALVVAAAVLLAPESLYVLQPNLSSLEVLVVVIVVTLLANALVLRLALAPLTELERAADRVAGGDLAARAQLSPLADRPLAELTRTFNRMVENVEAQRRLGREVASRALTDSEESKRRLSRDLRDDTAQSLASVMIRLRAVKSLDDAAARERAIDDVRDSMTIVIDQLRSFSSQLRPSGLDLLGVDQLIESYAEAAGRDAGVRVQVERESLRGALPPAAELELLRIAEEVVDRAVDTAKSAVAIDIRRDGGYVAVTIRCDGGNCLRAGSSAAGLFALQERASYFGGTIDVPIEGGASSVRIRFPMNRAA
ncbi:MAG TPA: HAMP domain-containing protein [Longimicrobiales bacterium]